MQAMLAALGDEGRLAHRSRISRWESGAVKPTWDAVRRYEGILELAPRRLAAAIDATARAELPQIAAPWLTRPTGPDAQRRALQVLDDLDVGAPVDGMAWDDLTSVLAGLALTLVPSRTWLRIIRRGIDDLASALQLEYALRFEGLARLSAHPQTSALMLQTVREVVAEPGYPVFSEAISLLRFSPDPAAGELLLDLIAAPANPLVLRAAMVTYTARLSVPVGGTALSTQAGRAALASLRTDRTGYRVRHAAADMLLRVPDSQRERLSAALAADRIEPAHLAVLRTGNALDPPHRSQLTARVNEHLERELGPLQEDRELRRRLALALECPNDEIRGQALLVLMLTPLAVPIAAALGDALAEAVATADTTLAQEALRPLTYLAGPAQLDLLTRVVTSAGPAASADQLDVAAEAGWALGNVVEPPGTAAQRRDDLLRETLAAAGAAEDSRALPQAVLYALAMRGQAHSITAAGLADKGLRDSLRWWQRHRA